MASLAVHAALTEAVAMLHLLHDVPERPSTNIAPELVAGKNTLSFENEQSLANALAFLVGADDPKYVPAICICEDFTTQQLVVLVAVNQSSFKDGSAALGEAKCRLDTILKSLRPENGVDVNVELVFTAIVRACSQRIISRMGYGPQKRQHAKKNIQLLLNYVLRWRSDAPADVQSAINAVITATNSWLADHSVQSLSDLVIGIHDLSQHHQLKSILDSISNSQMDPGERRSLFKIVSRVARYRDIAQSLCRLASIAPVRKMKAVSVTMPKKAFPPSTASYHPNFKATYTKLQLGKDADLQCSEISALLSKPLSKQFSDQCRLTMQRGKLHAEPQLVYFLLAQRSDMSTRAIASSKKACFLCNRFLKHVAKIHTRGSHGRLYPTWRLPLFPAQYNMNQGMVDVIERECQSAFQMLVCTKTKVKLRHPSESSLWTLENCASSAVLPTQAPHTVERSRGGLCNKDRHLSYTSMASMVSSMATQVSSFAMTAAIAAAAKSAQLEDNITLIQGIEKLVLLKAGVPIVIRSDALVLCIDYTARIRHHNRSTSCNVTWLTTEDSEQVWQSERSRVLTASALTKETILTRDLINRFYLTHNGHLLRLDLGE